MWMTWITDSGADAEFKTQEQRTAAEQYVAAHFGSQLTSDEFWNTQAPQMEPFLGMRRRAAEIAARYPAVSPDELARASAIVAPQIQEVADWRANFPAGGEALRGFVASGFASIPVLFSIVCGLISVLAVPGGLVTRALRHAVVRRDGREIGRVAFGGPAPDRVVAGHSRGSACVGSPDVWRAARVSPDVAVRRGQSRVHVDGGWRRVDHCGSRPRTARPHRRHVGCAKVGNGQGVDDADISVLRGSSDLRGYRPHAAGGGTGRSTARTGVLQGSPALCERDGGRLWGVSLCAPLVIADQRTHTLATSQPAPDAPWPRVLGLVNAPIEWGGTTWVSFNWDFVAGLASPRSRRELFIHEMFHRVQPGLGLMQLAAANEHVDAMDGRYWLRLEWRALARALQESGAARVDAVRDALAFRQARRALYAGSAEDERKVEITEGLPNYTGIVVAASSPADAIASAVDLLLGTAGIPDSFVRTFPSTTIPAYGLLLDASSDGWRRRVRNTDDIGTLLMNALSVQPAADAAASAARYGGAEIRRSEEQREQQRQDRLAALRRQFIDGPVLVMPGNGSAGSNSTGAVVIPGSGTVYFGAFKASGAWGTLEAEKGVLVASDGSSRRVSAPVRRDDGTFAGDGWTFKAAPGWVVREGARRGDYEVVRQQP